jgi:hypothetical protein
VSDVSTRAPSWATASVVLPRRITRAGDRSRYAIFLAEGRDGDVDLRLAVGTGLRLAELHRPARIGVLIGAAASSRRGLRVDGPGRAGSRAKQTDGRPVRSRDRLRLVAPPPPVS